MEYSLQIGLAQMAALIFSTGTLISRPGSAMFIVIFVGVTMAFSIASAMALGQRHGNKEIEELPRNQARLLGTHFGGMLCYLVTIVEAFRFI